MTNPNENLKALFQHAAAWRYHAKSMYNLCLTQMLEWPSITVDWVPDKKVVQSDRDYTLQYLATGTQALPGSQNYMSIMEMAIPMESDDIEDYYGGMGAMSNEKGNHYAEIRGHARVDQLIMVDSQILKIRTMPQTSSLIAVKMTNGYVSIFDIDRRPKFTQDVTSMKPDLRLRGHRKAGFGLDWNKCKLGYIASGGDDQQVCYWDIEMTEESGAEDLRPLGTLLGHTDCVHEVSWHATQDHLLASCSEDHSVRIWDTRSNVAAHTIDEAHRGAVHGVAFHPVAAFQYATCGADNLVKMWDIRKGTSVHTLIYHSNEVMNVSWAPFSDTVLASSGADRRVVMWDLQKVNAPHGEEEVEEFAPIELSFAHTGHLSRVQDIAWNPGLEDEWLMASVDMTNTLQIYKPAREVVYDFVAADVFDVDNGEA